MSSALTSWLTREHVAGIDISEDYIAACYLANRHGSLPTIRRVGWVKRTAGETPEDLVHQIRKLWKQARIPTRSVCSCFRSRALLLKQFRYEGVTLAELPSALGLEAEEMLQAEHGQLCIDWQLTNGGVETQQGSLEGVLVGARRELVEDHLAILKAAGLFPVALGAACLSLANLCLKTRGDELEDGNLCVVGISSHSADMVVLYGGGKRIYPRSIIARSPTWEKTVEYMVSSIDDNLKYCVFKLHEPEVQKVLFTGNMAGHDGLLAKFTEKTGIAAEAWNPLDDYSAKGGRIPGSLKSSTNDGLLLAPVLGTGLWTDSDD